MNDLAGLVGSIPMAHLAIAAVVVMLTRFVIWPKVKAPATRAKATCTSMFYFDDGVRRPFFGKRRR